jgi:L-asparaginase / beta-aspartyl-peptidase
VRPKYLGAAVYVAAALASITASVGRAQTPGAAPRIAFAIHGGAGNIQRGTLAPDVERAYRAGLEAALDTGYAILQRGGSAVDAVEAAIRYMEDDSLFNAGKGAVFTAAGTNELDAAVMDGSTLAAGSVAAVQHIKNPISLARMIMEKSPHVMLAGAGAEAFAVSQEVELVPPHYFFTERRWQQYEQARAAARAHDSSNRAAGKGTSDRRVADSRNLYGTVGAVALDRSGNLAAGTSTGGTEMKSAGRIGDSPIIGAGTYANNASCAVSATGHGEDFIRHTVASDICARVRYGHVPLARAADDVVMGELVAQKGEGGVIALDRAGHVVMPFNTTGMFRAYMGANGKPVVMIYRDE